MDEGALGKKYKDGEILIKQGEPGNCMFMIQSGEVHIIKEIDGKKVLAWFTPDIPISAGPQKYYGLPGLILEANLNQGQQVWLASSINLAIPGKDELFEPKEGKKVKPEQYKKIQEVKIEEWEKQQKMKKSDKVDYIGK